MQKKIIIMKGVQQKIKIQRNKINFMCNLNLIKDLKKNNVKISTFITKDSKKNCTKKDQYINR